MPALLIGATGMLADAARAVCARTDTAVVIARRASARPRADATLPIDADWSDEPAFARALDRAARHGPFDLALVWMHPRAPALRARLAALMAPDAVFVEVLGSRASRPGGIAEERLEAMRAHPRIRYRQVRLGFAIEAGARRWLTHEEISRAAIDALDTDETVIEAGRHEPWEARPA